MNGKPKQIISELSQKIDTLQATLEHVGAFVFCKDLTGKYTFANQKVCDLLNYPLAEIIGYDDTKFFSLDNANYLKKNDSIVIDEGKVINTEERIDIKKTGEIRYYLTEKKPLRDSNNSITGIMGVSADVTEIKQAQFQKTIQSEIMSQIVNKSPLKTILTSIVKSIEKQIPFAMCSILLMDDTHRHLLHGAAPNLPSFYNDAVHGLEINDATGSCGTAAFTKKRVIVEDIATHPYWKLLTELADRAQLGSCWSEPILSKAGEILGTFAIYHKEIASPKENDFKLIELASQLATIAIEQDFSLKQQQLFHQIYNNSHEGIMVLDPQGYVLDVNSAFCDITGYTLTEVKGKKSQTLYSNNKNNPLLKEMWQQIDSTHQWQGEIWNTKKDGESYVQLLTISANFDDEGEVVHYVGVFSDNTLRNQHQQELEQMAHYDLLTQLPNRALFGDRFNQAIVQSKRNKKQLAVCFIDLDNFKPVNDSFGHKTGDLLLIEVARRITEVLREQDTVCRQGGDEFAILLAHVDADSRYEDILRRLHTSIAKPYSIDDHTHIITASSGIALYPRDGNDIDTLLRHADQAMYQAKLAGKQRYEFFNISQNQKSVSKHARLEEIRQGLRNEEFYLYYQPKINMITGDVYGAEALIRWIHPQQGLIPPLEFLPITMGTDLENEIGDWVINRALIQTEAWHKSGQLLEVSINIASKHLLSDNFTAKLSTALAQCPDLDPQFIELEILETSALNDLSAVSEVIGLCQETLGVQFSLDDFGTGYSSLAHLRNLTVNTIKIDRTFVNGLLSDPSDYAIIEGIVGLSKAFNRGLIAEGVESTEHGLMLLIMGCEKAQGYGIAHPMSSELITTWLANYTPNLDWINYNHQSQSIKEKKVNIFRLISASWFNHFESNLRLPPEEISHWPILNRKLCHCEYWLKRVKQEHLFEAEYLDALDQVHERFQVMANSLFTQYQAGAVAKAREGLVELGTTYNDMLTATNQYT